MFYDFNVTWNASFVIKGGIGVPHYIRYNNIFNEIN